jgi:hypothetical protein
LVLQWKMNCFHSSPYYNSCISREVRKELETWILRSRVVERGQRRAEYWRNCSARWRSGVQYCASESQLKSPPGGLLRDVMLRFPSSEKSGSVLIVCAL